jgi:hypothetical protein
MPGVSSVPMGWRHLGRFAGAARSQELRGRKGTWSNKRGRGENSTSSWWAVVRLDDGSPARLALAKAVLERRYICRRAPRQS